jgi:methyl-accepting chemotaxis protein
MLGAGAPQGANAEAVQAQLQAMVQQIRQVGDLVQQIAASNPQLAQDAQQITQILKGMVVKSAQQAPAQTPSGLAVPGAGGA